MASSTGLVRSWTAALLSLLFAAACTPAHGYCAQGNEWIEYQGSCYYWSKNLVNWFNAELTCKRLGGGLTSIRSLNERDFLLRLTQCSRDFWIGMVNTDPQLRNSSRGYEWWDGTLFNYTSLSASGYEFRDCVYSNRNGNWQNYFCQHGDSFVCKAPAAVKEDQGESGEVLEWEQLIESDSVTGNWTGRTGSPALTTPEAATTASPGKCQPGWQLLDNNCYLLSAGRTNYFNAQMSCQAMAATVTSVLSPREHTLLTVALGCDSQTWIGLEKARPCFRQPGRDHCWVWMDRSPVNYFEWAPGQLLDRRDAECVILDGQWKVTNCYSEFRYLCKRPASAGKASA